jgi:hypothetical protein
MINERQKTVKVVRERIAGIGGLTDANLYAAYEVKALLEHIDDLQSEIRWAREHYAGKHDERHRLAMATRRFA